MKTKQKIRFFIIVFLIFIMVSSYITTTVIAKKYMEVSAEKEEGAAVLDATTATTSYASGMVVIEAESGRILYQKNCNERLAMASTTKIMTALLALESGLDLDEEFIVDERSVGIEGTSLYLRKGEKKTLKELLYGLMLPSGNDSAVAIACRVSGGEEEFVELMNQKAGELGLKNTSFANAHGLDSEGHYTSAYDLAVITAEAMKNPTFCEIVKTKNVTVSGNEEVSGKALKNKNKLLWSMEGCDGVKTGFTDNAKRCFVCSAKRDGMRLICVVLNCGPMFEEAERLLNMGFDNFKKYTLLSSYQPNETVPVKDGACETVKTLTRRHFSIPLTVEERANVQFEVELPKEIQAPVEKEQELGEVKVKLGDKVLFTEKIYAMEEVESTRFFDKVEQITDYWNI